MSETCCWVRVYFLLLGLMSDKNEPLIGALFMSRKIFMALFDSVERLALRLSTGEKGFAIFFNFFQISNLAQIFIFYFFHSERTQSPLLIINFHPTQIIIFNRPLRHRTNIPKTENFIRLS